MNEPIGDRIMQVRMSAALTQQEVADKIKTSRAYISAVENNRSSPTLDALQDIAGACKVTMAEMLDIRFVPDEFALGPSAATHSQLQAILDGGGHVAEYTIVVINAMYDKVPKGGSRNKRRPD